MTNYGEQKSQRQRVPCSCLSKHMGHHPPARTELVWETERGCSFIEEIDQESEKYYFIKGDYCNFNFSPKLVDEVLTDGA